MDKAEQYLIHCAGFYNFLTWMEEQNKAGMPSKIAGQTIYLHPLVSRFFALGIAKTKKLNKEPFLAIQPSESQWFSMIVWDKLCVRERDMHLYFVSKTIEGDTENYPDIPPFCVALSFDTLDKANILHKINNLVAREYRQDDNGEIKINFHNKIFSLPISHLSYDEPFMKEEKVINYTDLMLKKEKVLEQTFLSAPEFQGDINIIPGSESLFEKLKKKWL